MEGRVELEADDRELLVGFVRNLRALLRSFVVRRPALIPEDSALLLRSAWEELENENRFESLENHIRDGEYDGGLIEHGLYGRQLAMKVGVYDSTAEVVRERDGKFIGLFKKKRWIWKAAFKAADVALASAADAIPGGAVVREFKEGAEAALDQEVPLGKRIRASVGRPQEIEIAMLPPPAAPAAPAT